MKRTPECVVLDRQGKYNPKAKALQIHANPIEASAVGIMQYGRFNFQIVSYSEFKRTQYCKQLMRKFKILERIRNYANAQKRPSSHSR